MKTTELLRIATPILSILTENGIMRDDYLYLDVYLDYLNMRDNHVKYKVAIQMLAEEKRVSTRTLERIFKRFSKDCT